MTMELCDRSAAELISMLRTREIRSMEITESVFRRIEEREKSIHAYITTSYESAMQQALEADRLFENGSPPPPRFAGSRWLSKTTSAPGRFERPAGPESWRTTSPLMMPRP